MKRFWRVISIVIALAAGAFLYDGGKLLLIYRDLRVGCLTFAAGLLEVLVFVWCTYKSYGKAYGTEETARIKQSKRREAVFTWIVCVVAAVGAEMYCFRFGSVRRMMLTVGITIALLVLILVVLLAVRRIFPIAERE